MCRTDLRQLIQRVTIATTQHRTTVTTPQHHKTMQDRTTKEEVAIIIGGARTIETTTHKEATIKIDSSRQRQQHRVVFSIMAQIPFGLIKDLYKTCFFVFVSNVIPNVFR